jgi:hypothetical protein
MALGYEGYIQLDGSYVLGTGTSVPRARARIDSTSGYGGNIQNADMGIGSPHNYDWLMWDGSVSFEVSQDLWSSTLKTWPFDRQTSKSLTFSSRKDNVQQFDDIFFNSISVSAAEGSAVDGSVGFTAIERTSYSFGSDYIGNKFGEGLLCPVGGFPEQLNGSPNNNPVPFWNTQVYVDGTPGDFLDWSLDITQPVETFFGCTGGGGADPGPQEPIFLACGPLEVRLSGTLMKDILVDSPSSVVINVAGSSITLSVAERQSSDDDVQSGESFVVQNVEYEAFAIA